MLTVLALALLQSEFQVGARIDHPEPRFTVSLPAEYKAAKETLPETLYVYRRLRGTRASDAMDILISRNARHLAPEDIALKAEQLREALSFPIPKTADLRAIRQKWKGLEIPVLEARYPGPEGRTWFCRSALFPLVPKAVELHVSGPLEYADDATRDHEAMIAGFTGTVDWLTPSQKRTASIQVFSGRAALALILLYGLAQAAWFRRAGTGPLPRVAWLVAACLAFVADFVLAFSLGNSVRGTPYFHFWSMLGAAFCAFLAVKVLKEGRADV